MVSYLTNYGSYFKRKCDKHNQAIIALAGLTPRYARCCSTLNAVVNSAKNRIDVVNYLLYPKDYVYGIEENI